MGAKKDKKLKSTGLKEGRNPQLWLSLLEDADKVEWPPTLEGQKWHVSLTRSASLQENNHKGLYRTSPVFAATSDFQIPDLSKKTYYLCFFCFDPAFPV